MRIKVSVAENRRLSILIITVSYLPSQNPTRQRVNVPTVANLSAQVQPKTAHSEYTVNNKTELPFLNLSTNLFQMSKLLSRAGPYTSLSHRRHSYLFPCFPIVHQSAFFLAYMKLSYSNLFTKATKQKFGNKTYIIDIDELRILIWDASLGTFIYFRNIIAFL